jgi:HK97 family phage major capsid protein
MSRQTDQILARYIAEIEDRQQFIDGVLESANGEDLSDEKLELVTRARERIEECNNQMKPLEEARRISVESGERIKQLAKFMDDRPPLPADVEYRSVGAYVMDRWRADLGEAESRQRLEVFHRAAAHQTTGDNPGLLPEQILGPVLNFIDQARPIVGALGVRQLPAGTWSRPRVTQHTQVGEQTAEKAELVSRKMIVSKIPVEAVTYGGYVNISRQNIDWSQPQVMDLVINDLAAQYAIETEEAAAAELLDQAETATTGIDATPTGEEVGQALWGAVGEAFAAVKGQGRIIALCSPDVLGKLGPLFPPVAPQDSQSTGFTASQFGSGLMGQIGGIPVYMSAALAAKTLLIVSTAAAEAYEDRIGALQVVEPSVLGVQVAYAGYFVTITLESGGVIQVPVA